MKIWWDTSSFEPGDDRTVSTFLARVGRVVPLESSRWGLEDYAVEIDGFEILHFQEIESIMRDHDEVVIRPLSGTEIRQRRLSGRRQISTSGRKLIDGTPFGRPLLAPAPDRPQLSIPPRKRIKIGSEAVDDSTLVQVGSDPDDDTEDESYCEGDEDDDGSLSGSESEGEDLRSDSMSPHRILPAKPSEEFSGEYNNPLMDYYYEGEGGDAERDTTLVSGDDGSSEEDSDESSDESSEEEEGLGNHNPGVNSEDPKKRPAVNHIAGANSKVGEHKQSETDQEAAPVGAQSDSEEDSGDDCFEVSGESGGEDEDGDRSFGSSSESSVETNGIVGEGESLESVGSDGSGDSDKSEQSVGKAECQPVSKLKPLPSANHTPFLPSGELPPQAKQQKKLAVAPGTLPFEGSSSTKARNHRKKQARKIRRRFNQLKRNGLLPPESSFTGFAGRSQGPSGSRPVQTQARAEKPGKNSGDQLADTAEEAGVGLQPSEPGVVQPPLNEENMNAIPREIANSVQSAWTRKRWKRAFSRAIKKGIIPSSSDFEKWLEGEKKKSTAISAENNRDDQHKDGAIITEDVAGEHGEPSELTEPPSEESSKKGSHGQDILDAPRPFTLGGQGVENPINSAEEADLGNGLAEIPGNGTSNKLVTRKARKIVFDDEGNSIPVYTGIDNELGIEDQQESGVSDAWREKIALSAVECEEEEVALDPGFPFQQPLYRNGVGRRDQGNRKRKRKSGPKKKQPLPGEENGYGNGYDGVSYQQEYDDWEGHNYYDDTTVAPVSGNTVLADAEKAEDLPPLPEDVASLCPLPERVIPGTVVAFKQLTMAQDYTPMMTGYRTAIVEAVHEQGGVGLLLQLRLAKRDWPQREIDPETGQKILRKFEMPGDEDEEEGLLELMLGELLEPRVIKLPEDVGAGESPPGGGNCRGGRDRDNPMGTELGERDAIGKQGSQEGVHGTPVPCGESPTPGIPARRSPTPDIQVAITVPDGPPPASGGPEADGSQYLEQSLELGIGVDIQYAQPQEAIQSSSPPQFEQTKPVTSSIPATVVGGTDPPILPVANDEDRGSSFNLDHFESDSDGLESLESMLASQSQKMRVKPEPSSQDRPSLPPLPTFFPLSTDLDSDERQIHIEAGEKRVSLVARSGARSAAGLGERIDISQAQVIDLTGETSDPGSPDVPERERRKGRRRGRGKQWRAVKG